MTQRYLFICVFVLLSVVVGAQLFPRKQIPFSSSSVTTNLASLNLIDVGDLGRADYERVLGEKYYEVFIIKGGSRKRVYFNDKPLQSLELSPSRKRVAFSYFSSSLTAEEELSIRLLDLDSGENKEVYHTTFPSWDVTSKVHWIGNDHLFFLRHCGTECEGISLLNLKSEQTTNAVLSYPPFPDQPEQTHFKDWFGKEFAISGLVDDVESETVDNLHYLVFRMKDYEGNSLGEKKFQFTEREIMEKN